VVYASSTSALATGSALTFDGANLLVGGSSVYGATITSYASASRSGGLGIRNSAGTAAGGIYTGAAGSGSGSTDMYVEGVGLLGFITGGSEQMRLTSSSLYTASGINVGIGTSSPTFSAGGGLHISNATAANVRLQDTTTNVFTNIWQADNGSTSSFLIDVDPNNVGSAGTNLFINTAGSTKLTLNSAGNLGLGVTPSASLSTRKVFQFGATGSVANNSGNTLLGDNYYTDNTPANIYLTTGFATAYQQTTGEHRWLTAASGTAGNSISFTQAMTLTAAGTLLVGKTSSNNGTNGAQLSPTTQFFTNTNDYIGLFNRKGTDGVSIYFQKDETNVGNISVTTSATAYNTSSDYRLKNITGPITSSGAYIDSLNPVEGTWKADGSTFVGLIAHEVQEASRTQVATGVKDGEEMQAMDYSNSELIANLIAEVKSLRQRVATLEAQ
jgi:hypothetical protein